MARNLNSVTLLGAVPQKAELRYTAGGLAILEIPLAGIDHATDHTGNPIKLHWYHRITLFGERAEDLVDTLTAGALATVHGRLDYSTWEDKKTGVTRKNLNITAYRVEAINTPPNINDLLETGSQGQPILAQGAINRVEISGNLTKDAEYRLLPGQNYGVNRLSVAVNDEFKDRRGNQQNRTHFVDAELWRDLATASANATKGTPVFISGRLKTHTWDDKDGNKRYANRLEATSFAEFNRPKKTTTATNTPAAGETSTLDIDADTEVDLPF